MLWGAKCQVCVYVCLRLWMRMCMCQRQEPKGKEERERERPLEVSEFHRCCRELGEEDTRKN